LFEPKFIQPSMSVIQQLKLDFALKSNRLF
jgi:hypothetical protein